MRSVSSSRLFIFTYEVCKLLRIVYIYLWGLLAPPDCLYLPMRSVSSSGLFIFTYEVCKLLRIGPWSNSIAQREFCVAKKANLKEDEQTSASDPGQDFYLGDWIRSTTLCNKLLHKMGHYFLDIWYMYQSKRVNPWFSLVVVFTLYVRITGGCRSNL